MNKKLVSLLLAIACFITIFPHAIAAQSNNLYIVIDYPEGFLKQKYDVSVYFNDELIKIMKYGEKFSTVIGNLNSGTYTLALYNSRDKSVKASKPIFIDQDTTLSFEIDSKKKNIEITSYKLSSGIEGSQIKFPNLKYVYLERAESLLKDLGFIDIQHVTENNGSIKNKSNWLVISQNVEEGSYQKSTVPIVLTCRKINTFLQEIFKNKRLPAAIEEVNKYSFNVTYKDSLTYDTIDRNSLEVSDEWKVVSATSGYSSSRQIILSLLFEGDVIAPNLTNMRLSDAVDLLHKLHFSNIEYYSWDGSSITKTKDWKVVEQSIPYGDTCKGTDLIRIKCITTEKGDEQVRSNTPDNQFKFTESYGNSSKIDGQKYSIISGTRKVILGTKYVYYIIDYTNNIIVQLTVEDYKKEKDTYSYSIYHIVSNEKSKLSVTSSTGNSYSFKIGSDNRGSYLSADTSLKYHKTDLKTAMEYMEKSGFFDKYPLPDIIR